jgi:hypothetical protein
VRQILLHARASSCASACLDLDKRRSDTFAAACRSGRAVLKLGTRTDGRSRFSPIAFWRHFGRERLYCLDVSTCCSASSYLPQGMRAD